MTQHFSGTFFGSVLLLAMVFTLPNVYALDPATGFNPASSAISAPGSGNPDEENLQVPWTLINTNPGWTPRVWHCSVVLPDNSIVLMGGSDRNSQRKNDVWRSTDNGLTWTMQTANAGWLGRHGHTCVALPEGGIVLMGGSEQSLEKNDTWRSNDKGVTWRLVNASSGWTERRFAGSAVLPDGTIILTGGFEDARVTENNDVWKSEDGGSTWQLVNPNAAWISRRSHSIVALHDGSIVVMGGFNLQKMGGLDDTWRSTNLGISWDKVNSGTWRARYDSNSVVLPDESIVMIGGCDISAKMNDVWRSSDKGTTWQPVNGTSLWTARWGHSSTVMQDGSIIVTGGSTKDWQDGGTNEVWRLEPGGSSSNSSYGDVVVTKEIQPYSLKEGTDARITITVMNKGKIAVHDVEILDTTLPEFPVTDGTFQYSASMIEPGDSRILTYTVHATKAGSYHFDKTTVMYSGPDGNYYRVYSGVTEVSVLESLFKQGRPTGEADFFQSLVDWLKRL